jgi:hypothetical protein
MVQMLRGDIRNRQARCGQQVFYSGLFRIGKDVHIVVSKKVDFFCGRGMLPRFYRGWKHSNKEQTSSSKKWRCAPLPATPA